jgi:hypothetical protein
VKVTVEELTEGILRLCVGGEGTLGRDVKELRGGVLREVDKDVALGELFLLRISLAAYAVQRFLTPAVQQEARMAFSRGLHAILMDSEDKEIMGDPNKMIDGINERYCQYLEAIQAPHHRGPAWNVGNVFATLCGEARNLRVVMAAATEFGGALVAVREFLKKCKGMDGGEVINLPEEQPPQSKGWDPAL